MMTMDVETLREWLEQKRPVVVLDVRPGTERAEWAIPGSIHIDAYNALKANDPHALAGIEFSADVPVVTICAAGKTSLVAAQQLQARGGLCQIITGPLSDRLGRKQLIGSGMAVQAAGIWLIVVTGTFGWWLVGTVLLGLGTAMVYPLLIAVISDVATPTERARALGVYRFWRDMGYAIGALLAGVLADLFGLSWAIAVVGGLTLLSGVVVLKAMSETLRRDP